MTRVTAAGAAAILRKSRRLLALGVIFFLTGAGFMIWDNFFSVPLRPEELSTPRVIPAAPTQAFALGGYPSPQNFRNLRIEEHGLSDASILEIEGVCADEYFTVLIFPAGMDYREDPSRASLNWAFPCPSDGKIDSTLSLANLKNISAGDYYVFIADQPARGLWYNPRQ